MFDFDRYHVFDGGFGTMLQSTGVHTGHNPERLNISKPDTIRSIHRAYAEAGADILTTNTFGASRHKLGEDPAPFVSAGVRLAKEAALPYGAAVALDVGPLGGLMEPFGDQTFEDTYESYQEIVMAGAVAGADLILIETMSDLLETKAALLAAKDHTDLPVFVTMTFGEDGKTFIGVDPSAAAVTLTSLGADAIGVNCSLGPDKLMPIVETILASTHLPVIVQPNAGIPHLEHGNAVFDVSPDEFSVWMQRFLDAGVSIVGGCCGTTPEHITSIRKLIDRKTPARRNPASCCRLCGWQGVTECTATKIHTVGELINPTGRKKLIEAWDYVAELAIKQTEDGADFLVVNAGLPDIDEKEALRFMIPAIQKVSPLPLVIDCSDPAALEGALRICRGRPILNSVNGNAESLQKILPLAVKYNTGLIVLALDENGIADTAEERCNIGLRVARAAEKAGVARHDIFVDCLALTASAGQKGILPAINAIRMVHEQGYMNTLGVSNVSYGLPDRDTLNCTFLAATLTAGLNLAIVETGSKRVMDTIDAARVLTCEDEGCTRYIEQHKCGSGSVERETESLEALILSGRKSDIPAVVSKLLEETEPLLIINEHIVPAMDQAGAAYEQGTLFLPQLMNCAEAVNVAFDVLDKLTDRVPVNKGTVVLATVRGDIHDIGKNITGMLLRNYGYHVIDLGKDVSEEMLVSAVKESSAKLVGLSALMTTTAQNMLPAIRALREAGLDCKVMIGGAVVTEDFASLIGADYYAKDATQSAKIAAEVFA